MTTAGVSTDSRLIKSELWPLDDGSAKADVEGDMESLAAHGLIEEGVRGRRQVVLPDPLDERNTRSSAIQNLRHCRPRIHSRKVPGNGPGTVSEPSVLKGREGKGREPQNRSASLAPFEADFDEM